jgi:hypothetical protein
MGREKAKEKPVGEKVMLVEGERELKMEDRKRGGKE